MIKKQTCVSEKFLLIRLNINNVWSARESLKSSWKWNVLKNLKEKAAFDLKHSDHSLNKNLQKQVQNQHICQWLWKHQMEQKDSAGLKTKHFYGTDNIPR